MAATIEIGGIEATVEDGQWTCIEDGPTEDLLNAMFPGYEPGGEDPNPDLHLAERMAKAIGGKVVSFDPVPYVEGRVY